MRGFSLDPDVDNSPAKAPNPTAGATENGPDVVTLHGSKRRKLDAEGTAQGSPKPLTARNGSSSEEAPPPAAGMTTADRPPLSPVIAAGAAAADAAPGAATQPEPSQDAAATAGAAPSSQAGGGPLSQPVSVCDNAVLAAPAGPVSSLLAEAAAEGSPAFPLSLGESCSGIKARGALGDAAATGGSGAAAGSGAVGGVARLLGRGMKQARLSFDRRLEAVETPPDKAAGMAKPRVKKQQQAFTEDEEPLPADGAGGQQQQQQQGAAAAAAAPAGRKTPGATTGLQQRTLFGGIVQPKATGKGRKKQTPQPQQQQGETDAAEVAGTELPEGMTKDAPGSDDDFQPSKPAAAQRKAAKGSAVSAAADAAGVGAAAAPPQPKGRASGGKRKAGVAAAAAAAKVQGKTGASSEPEGGQAPVEQQPERVAAGEEPIGIDIDGDETAADGSGRGKEDVAAVATEATAGEEVVTTAAAAAAAPAAPVNLVSPAAAAECFRQLFAKRATPGATPPPAPAAGAKGKGGAGKGPAAAGKGRKKAAQAKAPQKPAVETTPAAAAAAAGEEPGAQDEDVVLLDTPVAAKRQTGAKANKPAESGSSGDSSSDSESEECSSSITLGSSSSSSGSEMEDSSDDSYSDGPAKRRRGRVASGRRGKAAAAAPAARGPRRTQAAEGAAAAAAPASAPRSRRSKQQQQQQQQLEGETKGAGDEVVDLASHEDAAPVAAKPLPRRAAARGRRSSVSDGGILSVTEVPAAAAAAAAGGAAPSQQQQQQPAVPKGPVPTMFLGRDERRRLLQQQRQAERDAAEAAVAAEAAARDEARTVRQRAAAAAAAAAADKPLHPFFSARPESAGAGAGVGAGAAGVGGGGGGGNPGVSISADRLKPALAPVHVIQADEAAAAPPHAAAPYGLVQQLLAKGHGVPPSGAAQSIEPTVGLGLLGPQPDCRAWTLPASMLRPSQCMQGHAAPADAAAVTPSSTCEGGEPHAVLLQLAHHMRRSQEAAAAPQDASLLDLPSISELVAGLSSELTDLQRLAATNCAAAGLGPSSAAAAAAAREPTPLPGTPRGYGAASEDEAGASGSGPARQSLGPAPAGSSAAGVPAPQTLSWAAKYAPTAATQLCGNAAAGVALRQWLAEWHEARDAPGDAAPGAAGGGTPAGAKEPFASESNSWLSSDFEDSQDSRGGKGGAGGGAEASSGRCAAITVVGPTGSGKSAAVYAVAQELGYNVLEVNPSVDRTAGTLTRLVGEATQSQRLARGPSSAAPRRGSSVKAADVDAIVLEEVEEDEEAVPARRGGRRGRGQRGKAGAPLGRGGARKRGAAVDSDDGSGGDFEPPRRKKRGGGGGGVPAAPPAGRRGAGATQGTAAQPSNPLLARLRMSQPAAAADGGSEPGTPAATTAGTGSPCCGEAPGSAAPAAAASQPRRVLSVVLFDEADVLLGHDRGFAAALLPLVRSARCPVVLCFSSPVAPSGLEGLVAPRVELRPPAPEELLRLLALVVAAEGVPAAACSLEQLQGIVGALGPDIRACLTAAQFWCSATSPAPDTPPSANSCTVAPWCWREPSAQLQQLADAVHGALAASAQTMQNARACPDQQQSGVDSTGTEAEERRAAAAAERRRLHAFVADARLAQEASRLEAAWALTVQRAALAKARQRAAAAAGEASGTPGASGGTEEIWMPGDDPTEDAANAIGCATIKGKGKKQRAAKAKAGNRAAALAAIEAAARRRAAAAAAAWADEDEESGSGDGSDGEGQEEAEDITDTPLAQEQQQQQQQRQVAVSLSVDPMGIVLLQLQVNCQPQQQQQQESDLQQSHVIQEQQLGADAAAVCAGRGDLAPMDTDDPCTLSNTPAEPLTTASVAAEAGSAPGDAAVATPSLPASALPPVTALPPPPLQHAGTEEAAAADPVAAALRALAAAAHALSDFDLLSAPRDPAAPVSGPCARMFHTVAPTSLSAHLGRNAALAVAAASHDWQLPGMLAARAAGAAPPAWPGADDDAWSPGAGAWLAHMAVHGEDGTCLEAALSAAEEDEGSGPMAPPPRQLHTSADGGVAGGVGGEMVAGLLAAAAAAEPGRIDALATVPHQISGVTPTALPAPATLHLLSRALLLAAPGAAAHGRRQATQRAAALAAVCRAEAVREAEQEAGMRGVRVRRAVEFDHHLRWRLGALLADGPLLNAVMASACYGR